MRLRHRHRACHAERRRSRVELTPLADGLPYTANGELATRTDTATSAVTQYGYDSGGALRTVVLPNGDAIEYVLDPAGRRIGKKVNGVLEQAWLYQDGLRPIAELDGMGNVVSAFVYATGVNVPDYMVRGGATYRILRDHLGSVRLVIDVATGSVVQRMEHDEWGRVITDTNPGWQPFGYAGGLWDADTGLVHFGAREYDADTGRWTSKDPIGFRARDANIYAYVRNDPANALDPSGLRPCARITKVGDRFSVQLLIPFHVAGTADEAVGRRVTQSLQTFYSGSWGGHDVQAYAWEAGPTANATRVDVRDTGNVLGRATGEDSFEISRGNTDFDLPAHEFGHTVWGAGHADYSFPGMTPFRYRRPPGGLPAQDTLMSIDSGIWVPIHMAQGRSTNGMIWDQMMFDLIDQAKGNCGC